MVDKKNETQNPRKLKVDEKAEGILAGIPFEGMERRIEWCVYYSDARYALGETHLYGCKGQPSRERRNYASYPWYRRCNRVAFRDSNGRKQGFSRLHGKAMDMEINILTEEVVWERITAEENKTKGVVDEEDALMEIVLYGE